MAALADEWDEQQQQCIDVLCAYLRLPYRPPVQRQRRGHGRRRAGDPIPGGGEDSVLAERQVRTTVVRVIRDHLQPEATHSWEGRNFDFTGAHFDAPTSVRAEFTGGTVDFSGAQFSGGTVDFYGAQFSGGTVHFDGAQFTGGTVDFDGAQFTGGTVDFVGAQFTGGTVNFAGAKFSGGQCGRQRTGPDYHQVHRQHRGFSDAEFTGEHRELHRRRVHRRHRELRRRRVHRQRRVLCRRNQRGTATFSGGTVSFSSA